jgi:hypothetical protein
MSEQTTLSIVFKANEVRPYYEIQRNNESTNMMFTTNLIKDMRECFPNSYAEELYKVYKEEFEERDINLSEADHQFLIDTFQNL